VYLKTHDVTGSEGFLRISRKNDAAHRKKARCPGALGVFRYTLDLSFLISGMNEESCS